jgi:hypothetical protein
VRTIYEIVRLRLGAILLISLTSAVGAGCASDEAARRDEARAKRQEEWNARHSSIQAASDNEDTSSPEMTVDGEEGALNSADVEASLKSHMGDILDCYRLGSRTAQKVGGRVLMRFFVDGKGEVQDVAILESSIANAGKGGVVERCLADIAVGVMFHPPAGRKPTTFDYPFEFRPARQVTAQRQRRP